MNKREPDELNALLLETAKGNQEAFRELYDLTHNKLYFFVARMVKDQMVVEEVVVDTYTAAWKNAGKFKGRSKVQTWIFGIARNLAMNAIRKQRHHSALEELPHLATNGSIDNPAADRKDMIAKGLQILSSKHQQVLEMVFFQGFNYEEIADILDVSVNTVKTRVFYAKKALHQTLDKMGVTKNDI